jgi:hypothetical protein
MEYDLLSREECQEIVKNNETFYCSEKEYEGFKIEMYDYRLATYNDFFPENQKNRTELRGYTFILNPNTNEWEKHIALQKFFNVNQTTNWMEEDLQNKKVISFSDKRDGSLILPVKLPNGKIRMKTKMSFVSSQADGAQEIYENNINYQNLIDYCESKGIQTIWEYTSYDNQIVLMYNNKELSLLQARYKKNGQYLTQNELIYLADKFSVKITEQYNVELLNINKPLNFLKAIIGDRKFDTLELMLDYLNEHKYLNNDLDLQYTSVLDFLLFSRDYIEKEEGVVITFDDGQMAKIKHTKYFQMHGIVTEGTRENLLIQTILEDNIDDVIAQILPGEKRDFILEISNIVMKHFNHSIAEIKNRINSFNGDRKEFAIKNKSYKYFSVLMSSLNSKTEKDIENNLKIYLLKITNGLDKSKKWLEAIKLEN